jgi:hypothetical protein
MNSLVLYTLRGVLIFPKSVNHMQILHKARLVCFTDICVFHSKEVV